MIRLRFVWCPLATDSTLRVYDRTRLTGARTSAVNCYGQSGYGVRTKIHCANVQNLCGRVAKMEHGCSRYCSWQSVLGCVHKHKPMILVSGY